MARNGLKKLRYAAVSVNLLGLILSVGTWAFNIWARTHSPSRLYRVDLIWTAGVFWWVLGLIMFIAVWIVEGFADNG
jgi:hypothetical protein